MEPEISEENKLKLIIQSDSNITNDYSIMGKNFFRFSLLIIIILILIISFSPEKKQKNIIDNKSIEDIERKVKDYLKKELEEELKKYDLKKELKEELKKYDLKKELKEEFEEELKKYDLKKELKEEIKEEIKKEYFDKLMNGQLYENEDYSYPDIKVCLCSIGKKENLYVEEFVNNYIKLGYDKIFLYDNNDKDGERMDDVLKKQIANNFVKIIDLRGFSGKRQPQFEAYYDCYEKNSNYCDWLSFFDFDEFLYLKNNKNIKQVLSDKKFEKCDNVKINWIVYSDNNLVYYDDRKVQEVFQYNYHKMKIIDI